MSETTVIEQYIIDCIREERTKRGISQAQLARLIGVSEGFIGNVENPKYRDKYNFKHLNAIAKALDCSPRIFLPDKAL